MNARDEARNTRVALRARGMERRAQWMVPWARGLRGMVPRERETRGMVLRAQGIAMRERRIEEDEQEEGYRGARNERSFTAPDGQEGCLRIVWMEEKLLRRQVMEGDSKSK